MDIQMASLLSPLFALFWQKFSMHGALTLEAYNPGTKSIFPVSSVIISGTHQAILVDAQFQRDCALKLVEKIKQSGKTLVAIYISHSDPDYYFGAETLLEHFPGTPVIATPQTIAAVNSSQAAKLAHWGPILKDNAPSSIPEIRPVSSDSLNLEGKKIVIVGLDGPDPGRTFLWLPDNQAVVGGISIISGMHVWLADTKTKEARDHWRQTLKNIEDLKPQLVIPGHMLPDSPMGIEAVRFTLHYLETAEKELAQSVTSEAFIHAMQQRYPNLSGQETLEFGAKVLYGEIPWP